MPTRRRRRADGATHPGREVLEPAGEEQRGGQALARRPQAEGEPDLGARRLPGAGKRRPAPGGGGHEEGARPLPEHHQQVRESTRRLVRQRAEEEEDEGGANDKKDPWGENKQQTNKQTNKGHQAARQQQHFT